MSRGGYRPGSGRRKRPVNPVVIAFKKADKQATSDLQVMASARIDENGELILPPGWKTPLEYMMEVINDESADVDRRDRLAATAAPYFHSRVSGTYISERLTTLERAKSAGRGTEWAGVLKTVD